jgi:uncharacterized lipoprotein
MRRAPAIIICLLLVTSLTGCGLGMERVPDASAIRASKDLLPFLIEAQDIQGIYQNLDVDSALFTYSHRAVSENEFWDQLRHALKETGWKAVDHSGSIRRFEREFPKGKRAFSSAEQIRIGYQKNKAIVGYVQADSSKESVSFAETSEAEWAEKVIWPKFTNLLK